jgi:hypothetical protein
MRHLALFAALTLVAAACNTATDPADPALGEAAAPEASRPSQVPQTAAATTQLTGTRLSP